MVNKYKIKLKEGDYCVRRSMSDAEYRNCMQRFIDDSGLLFESMGYLPDSIYFGWHKENKIISHGSSVSWNCGRLLTYDQIMELAEPEPQAAWNGEGKPPVHDNVEWRGKRGGYFVRSRVVDYTEDQICLLHHSDQNYKPHKMEVFNFSDIDIRPIKTERDIAIEEIKKIIYQIDSYTEISIKLYDAGYRKVKS